jgi:C1A family cysteine protease
MVEWRSGVKPPPLTSRLYGYYFSREQHGEERTDSGTYLRTCIKAYNKLGRPPESLWPYRESKFAVKPPPSIVMSAFDRPLLKYHRVDSSGDTRVDEIKRCIASGRPVFLGTNVGEEMERCVSDAVLDIPAGKAVGHALCCVSYDENGLGFVNSWGTGFGSQGFARLSWRYVTWSKTRDIWALDL